MFVSIWIYNCSRKFRAQAHDSWRHLLTGNKSGFYYEYVWDRMWTAQDENTPETENRTIAFTKIMLTVLWNSHGFHAVTMLPPGEWFNTSSFINQNLVPLGQNSFPSGVYGKNLITHVDNAPARNSRMTGNFFEDELLKRFPHPPYSPDISPSNFYLFEKVKGTLIGQEIPDEIGLLCSVTEILNGISTDEWQCLFRSWIERIENVITAEGGYAS